MHFSMYVFKYVHMYYSNHLGSAECVIRRKIEYKRLSTYVEVEYGRRVLLEMDG